MLCVECRSLPLLGGSQGGVEAGRDGVQGAPGQDPASASWADLAQSSPSLSLSFSICTMRGVYLMISNFLETLTYSLCACAWACTAHQST